jgi:hypothetical protein
MESRKDCTVTRKDCQEPIEEVCQGRYKPHGTPISLVVTMSDSKVLRQNLSHLRKSSAAKVCLRPYTQTFNPINEPQSAIQRQEQDQMEIPGCSR